MCTCWWVHHAWQCGQPPCHVLALRPQSLDACVLRYIIPQSVVRHFLSEFTLSGRFRGVCSLGFRWQDLESQGLRAFLQVRGRAEREG